MKRRINLIVAVICEVFGEIEGLEFVSINQKFRNNEGLYCEEIIIYPIVLQEMKKNEGNY